MAVRLTGNTLNLAIKAEVSGTRQVGELTGQLQVLHTKARSLTDSFHNLAAVYAAWRVVTAVSHQIESFGQLAGDFQKLQNAMEEFSPSAQVAQERMEWLSELGQKTYGIREMTKAFIELSSAGIKPTEKQMEGMAAYLLSLGRTGPRSLQEAAQKMKQLQQTMNLGMDDSLKELTRIFPNAIGVLMKQLDKSYGEILSMFKGKRIDFPTISNALLADFEQNWAQKLDKAANTYDVFINRIKAKGELFEKTLMDQGLFESVTRWLEDIVGQLDDLARNGQFEAWASRVAQVVRDIGSAFGLADPDIKKVGDEIVRFIEEVGKGAPTLTTLITAIKTLGGVLTNIIGITAKIPGSEYGIIGALLFGWKAGVVVGAIGAAYELIKETADTTLAAGTDAMGIQTGYDYEDVFKLTTRSGWKTYGPRLEATLSTETKNLHLVEDAVRESTQGYQDLLAAMSEKDKKTQEWLAAQKKARQDGAKTTETTNETNLPGYSDVIMAVLKERTTQESLLKQMVKAGATAGLEGYDLYAAQMNEKLKEWNEAFEKRIAYLQKAKELAKGSARETEHVEELLKQAAEENKQFQESYQKALEDTALKYSGKAADKWTRNVIDKNDVDQIVSSIRNDMGVIDKSIDQAKFDLQQKIATLFGDPTGAMKAQADREATAFVDELNLRFRHLKQALEEFDQKIHASGKHPTEEVEKLYQDLKAAVEKFDEEKSIAGAQIAEARVNYEIQIYKDQKKLTDALSLVSVRAEYAALTGSMEEQAEANAQLIEQEGQRALYARWLAGASAEELTLIKQIYAEKARIAQLEGSDSFFEGFKQGFQDIRNGFSTLAQDGKAFARDLDSSMQSEFKTFWNDLFWGKYSDPEETFSAFGEAAAKAFSDSFSNFLSKQLTKAFDGIFDFLVNSMSGLFGSSSAGGSSAFSFDFGAAHTGWVVGHGAAPMTIAASPNIFAGAPRLHSGLAADEYPAILQTGEEVVSRKDRATILSELRAAQKAAANSGGTGQGQSVTVNVNNQGSSQIKAESSSAKFDGRQWVIDVITSDYAQGGNIWKMIRGSR